MSWFSVNLEGHQTSYISEARNVKETVDDIKLVVDKMFENRAFDESSEANQLLFFVDSTNALVRVNWCDFESDKILGNFSYVLHLDNLWSNADGASVFTINCLTALTNYAKAYLFQEKNNPLCEVFYRTEILDARKLEI